MSSLVKWVFGPSQKELKKYIYKLLMTMNHYYETGDTKEYLKALLQLEICFSYLPLSKLIKMGFDLGGVALVATDSPFKHWLFYLIGEGSNITLEVQITVGSIVHYVSVDRNIT